VGQAADVAKSYFEKLSNGDVDGALDLCADGSEFVSPMGVMHGRDEIKPFLAGFDQAFPGARFDVGRIVESGDHVAVEGVYRGKHGGPMMLPDGTTLDATGREIAAPYVTMFEVSGGKIRSERPYWDMGGFMAQLTG